MTEKEQTTYPIGPLSYSRMVQALKEALAQEWSNYGLDSSEREKKRLFWRDDMELYTVIRWLDADASPTTVVSYDNDEIPPFEGDYVLKFVDTSRLTTAVRTHYFGPFPRAINSFEIRWWRGLNLQQMEFFLVTQPITGIRYYGALRWNALTGCWQYRDSNYVWHDLAGTAETINTLTWNYMRMRIDFQNLRLHHLISNALDVNLVGLAVPLQVDPTFVYDGLAYAGLRGRHNAMNSPCYVDDARIYVREDE